MTRTILVGNRLRQRGLSPIGNGSPTLLIASIGVSAASDSVEIEVAKASDALTYGASAVTDHSFYGDIDSYQRRLVDNLDCLVSAVTCYEVAGNNRGSPWTGRAESEFLSMIETQLSRGLDMLTVHATVLRRDILKIRGSRRLIPTTSKGGGILARYMMATDEENPYYVHFDTLLGMFKEHDAALSLGTTFRAATTRDTWDEWLAAETERMGELCVRAQDAGVAVMIEGFGHASINEMPTLINLANMYTRGAPYRVLPMASDRGLGMDHITGAIGAAAAVAAGASAVTAISRAEHIGLPTREDLIEAIQTTRIAIGCGELARGEGHDAERQMSRTRWTQGCKGDWSTAIDPEGAQRALASRGRLDEQRVQCGMCEDYCGINSGNASVNLGSRIPRRAT